jgi:hypothetical protein
VDTSSTWPDDRDFQNDEATDLTDDEWVWIAPMLPVVEIFRPEPRKGDETVILSALHTARILALVEIEKDSIRPDTVALLQLVLSRLDQISEGVYRA